MTQYKFDGRYLKYKGKIIANVSGKYIREGSGGKIVANIKDDKVRKDSGGSVLLNVKGNDVREGSGGRKIASMDDIRDEIDGLGGVTLAALWYCFIK